MENCKDKFTEKDLLYITDMFSWNLQALKLVNHFIEEVSSNDVREILEEAFDMHYENLVKCINILKCEDEECCYGEDDEDYDDDEDEDSYEEDDEEEEEDE